MLVTKVHRLFSHIIFQVERTVSTRHPLTAVSAHNDMIDVCELAVFGVVLQSVSQSDAVNQQRSARLQMNQSLSLGVDWFPD